MNATPRFRRGDTSPLRPGLVFLAYDGKNERWLTPELFEREKVQGLKRVREWATRQKQTWADNRAVNKLHVRGDISKEYPGLIFWGMLRGKERWVSAEQFAHLKSLKNGNARKQARTEQGILKRRKRDLEYAKTPKRRAFLAAYQRKHRRKFSENNKPRRQAYRKMRRATDPIFKLKANLGTRIRLGFKRKCTRKQTKCIDLLGCSYEFFKSWIERQFEPGMTFENYGFDTWHVDHIIPICLFDLSEPTSQRFAFNYRNTRPAWGKPNLSKNGRLDMALVAKHELWDWMPYIADEVTQAA